jgi:hypothetical protein
VLFAWRVGAKLGATSGRPLRRERASSLQLQPSVLIFVWRGLPRFLAHSILAPRRAAPKIAVDEVV